MKIQVGFCAIQASSPIPEAWGQEHFIYDQSWPQCFCLIQMSFSSFPPTPFDEFYIQLLQLPALLHN